MGVYCGKCIHEHQYLNTITLTCEPCQKPAVFFGALAGGLMSILLAVAIIAAILAPKQRLPTSTSRLRRCCHALAAAPRASWSVLAACLLSVWDHKYTIRLRRASAAVTLPVKLKQLLSFALVVAQIGDVYRIRYPDEYASVTHKAFGFLRLELFGWIPGLHLRCLGISSLLGELLLYSLLPLGIVIAAFGYCWVRYGSFMPALPFVLRFTFFFYPSVSSKGFQTLGRCDCFHTVNGTALCYLPADYSVACVDEYAPTELLATGWLAIALFGIGVPLLYASLLYSCRIAIRTEQKTPLATSLAFLHASLHPWALWWPLVETARALLLTGFLALVTPGRLYQLFCGLVVAFAFSCLQLWVAPYRTASNNLLAMALSAALVLDLISSLGVQVNNEYGGDVNPLSLSIVLYTAAFAVFPIALLSPLSAIRQRVVPAQMSAILLDDDSGHPAAGVAGQVHVQ